MSLTAYKTEEKLQLHPSWTHGAIKCTIWVQQPNAYILLGKRYVLHFILYFHKLTLPKVMPVSFKLTVGPLSFKHLKKVVLFFRSYKTEKYMLIRHSNCMYDTCKHCCWSVVCRLPMGASRAKNNLVFTASWVHSQRLSGIFSLEITQK